MFHPNLAFVQDYMTKKSVILTNPLVPLPYGAGNIHQSVLLADFLNSKHHDAASRLLFETYCLDQ